jgi:hypothetical protein
MAALSEERTLWGGLRRCFPGPARQTRIMGMCKAGDEHCER